ncbi:MAG: hypothetical protein NZ955_04800 [Candidatus Bathyarchaeota archaeon]|nr:hypothetical protein [Candidatus Bathyarchaeota archaeon]
MKIEPTILPCEAEIQEDIKGGVGTQNIVYILRTVKLGFYL